MFDWNLLQICQPPSGFLWSNCSGWHVLQIPLRERRLETDTCTQGNNPCCARRSNYYHGCCLRPLILQWEQVSALWSFRTFWLRFVWYKSEEIDTCTQGNNRLLVPMLRTSIKLLPLPWILKWGTSSSFIKLPDFLTTLCQVQVRGN